MWSRETLPLSPRPLSLGCVVVMLQFRGLATVPRAWDARQSFIDNVVSKSYMVIPAAVGGVIIGLILWFVTIFTIRWGTRAVNPHSFFECGSGSSCSSQCGSRSSCFFLMLIQIQLLFLIRIRIQHKKCLTNRLMKSFLELKMKKRLLKSKKPAQIYSYILVTQPSRDDQSDQWPKF